MFLLSCKTIDKKYLEENKPTISFYSVNIESINSDTVNFILNLKIKNNYNFDIVMTKSAVSIKNKNGTHFASVVKDTPIKIKSFESETVSFFVKGNYSGLIETLLLFFANTKLELYAEGEGVFNYKGLNIKVPIKTKFEIDTLKATENNL